MKRRRTKIKPIFGKIFIGIQSGGILCGLVADIMQSQPVCLFAWVLLLPGSLLSGFQICEHQRRGFSAHYWSRFAFLANMALFTLTAFLLSEPEREN